ncbi:MAG: class I SAM-dependent methyltransferase [Pseudomonadota bacterium]
MPDHQNHLKQTYLLDTQEKTDAFYADWAATYDAEVIENGYATPARLSAALKGFVPPTAKILDIGCGTGYSGFHLHQAGFRNITGTDPVVEMLEIALKRAVYTNIWQTDLTDPYPFDPGVYDVITAIGVITTGAAPATLLPQTIDQLAKGGLIAFSYNDKALEDPTYTQMRDKVLTSGTVRELYRNYGPHLTGKKINSDIYIFERL